MTKSAETDQRADQRSEARVESYSRGSVEFVPGKNDIPHQFNLKDFSSRGFGILVRKDSRVLQRIKTGDIFDMKYHPGEPAVEPVNHRTQIRHISEPEPGKHKDHMLVGLYILD